MLLRMFGGFLLASCLVFGSLGITQASINNNTSNNWQSQNYGKRHPKAVPELDSTSVYGLLLSGSTLISYEYRRRRNKQKK